MNKNNNNEKSNTRTKLDKSNNYLSLFMLGFIDVSWVIDAIRLSTNYIFLQLCVVWLKIITLSCAVILGIRLEILNKPKSGLVFWSYIIALIVATIASLILLFIF